MGNSPAPDRRDTPVTFFYFPAFLDAATVRYWYRQINQETIKTKNNAI